jgi:energy-coupling factor transporter ATP-binding protein EcfA2
MLDQITVIYLKVSAATKENPMLASAVGLWGLTALTFVLRNVPAALWNLFSTQCMTGISLNNSGCYGNRYIFQTFLKWFYAHPYSKFSRHLSLDADDDSRNKNDIVVGPGYGTHFFIFKYHLFWFSKHRLESTGGNLIKEEIQITMLGRNKKIIDAFVDAFKPKNKEKDHTEIFKFEDGYWIKRAEIINRSLSSVIVKNDVISELKNSLDDFYNRRMWFLEKHMQHKLTVCLHGKPGCGKTSLIKALAGFYNANIYVLNLNRVDDSKLDTAISTVPKGSFLLIEDFDCKAAFKTRDEAENDATSITSELGLDLTLSGILNALDGIVPIENVVIFMTTNHLELIDPAVLRKGRTDLIVELDLLSDVEIKQYIRYIFGDVKIPTCTFTSISGADLQAVLLENKDNYDNFIMNLQKKCGDINRIEEVIKDVKKIYK